jgi:DNA-binding MarR family transcriptional regulator
MAGMTARRVAGAASGSRSPAVDYAELELGRQLCVALYSASRAVIRAYGPLLEELGLTYPQYLVLLALWEQPDEALTVGGLGARLQLDSGTLTPLLKRLEGLGHVRRRRDESDERRVLIGLTPAGLALRERAAGIPRAIAGRTGLSSARLGQLRDELTRLVDVLGAAPS